MLARLKELGLTPAEPFRAGVVAHPYPATLDTDMHQAFELGVVLTGQEDRHFESTVLSLAPGEVWLCAAWEPHGWRATAPRTHELVLQFIPDFVGDEMLGPVSWLNLFTVPPDQRPRADSPELRERLLEIAQEMRQEMHEQRRGWLTTMRLGILRLLHEVSRDWELREGLGRQRIIRPDGPARVMPAVRLVHSNPGRRLSVAEGAAACGLSVSQFGHIFRHSMGVSFGKFRARARLGYVAQLLLSTGLPVESIAQATGFADASHVHHAFAKVYGCTPAHYRTEGQSVREFREYALIESSVPSHPELLEAKRKKLDR